MPRPPKTPSARETAVILIPTYNERQNITKLIPLIAKVFEKITTWNMQVLVIDDSSPDGTADAARELKKEFSFVSVLVNKKKAGLGGAYLKGMAHAFGEMGADVVFEMDADLSHDPKKIPEFLHALDRGADMVLGSRYMKGGSIPENWGLHRKFLSVVGNITIAVILTSRAVRDWTGGYRAIRRAVYEAVHEELEAKDQFSGYTFQIGFLHKALRRGFRVAEVPFHFIDRTIGESKLGTEYMVNTLKYLITVRAQEILSSRIFKFLMVGGIGFVVNFIFFRIFTAWRIGSFLSGASANSLVATLLSDQAVAVVLSAELAIISNYLLNNFWTFKDRKIAGLGHVSKFLQFNFGSVGSVVIQYLVMQVGMATLGLLSLFTLAGFTLETDTIYLVIGVLLGMIWNFTIYSKVIWRGKKK